jgi:hypothetical protein
MISVEQLAELGTSYRPAFEELLRVVWQQTWDDELGRQIVQWRYYDRPGDALTWVAIEEGRCIAMLDFIKRPYMLNGTRILVCETADWYCLPNRRSDGIGLRLLWKLRQYPEPAFVLGGSGLTAEALKKLRWTVLPSARSYVLPIRARGLLGNLVRQSWRLRRGVAHVVPSFLPIRTPKHIGPPVGRRAEIKMLAPNGTVPTLPVDDTGLTQLLETSHWQWLATMPPALAEPVGLLFLLDDMPVGVTFCQSEQAASWLDARIVHVQCADWSICAWVISATAEILASRGADFIRCCVSCKQKIAALEQVGFIKGKEVPCFWLPRAWPTPTSIDISDLRGGNAMPLEALRGRVRG